MEVNNENYKTWIEGFLEILNGFKGLNLTDLLKNFRLSVSPEIYLNLVYYLEGLESNQLEFFKYEGDSSNVIEKLKELCTQGKFSSREVTIIKVLHQIPEKWPWEILIPALGPRLTSPQGQESEEFIACAKSLFFLAFIENKEQGQNEIKRLVNDGVFINKFAEFSNNLEARAVCLLPTLVFKPDGNIGLPQNRNIYRNFLQNPANKDLVSILVNMMCEFNVLPDVLKSLYQTSGLNTSEFKKVILNYIIENKQPRECITTEDFLELYTIIKASIPQNFSNFLESYLSDSNFISTLINKGFSQYFIPLYPELVDLALPDQITEEFNNFLSQGISQLDRNILKEQFLKGGHIYKLILSLYEKGLKMDLGINCYEVLKDIATNIIQAKINVETGKFNFDYIIESLKNDFQMAFKKDLWDILLRNVPEKIEILEKYLEIFGKYLLGASLSSEKAGDILRTVFPKLLELDIGNDWILRFLKETSLFDSASKEDKAVFKERVSERLKHSPTETLKEIAKFLGINLED